MNTGNMPTPPDMDSGNMPTPPGTGSGNMPSPSGTDSTASAGDMPAPPDMNTGNMPASPDMDFNTNTGDGSTQPATAANDEETYISISGGRVTIINETGNDADGLDSNGDIFISGGTIYVSLTGSGSNSAVDYGSESGGVTEISGGTIIACGASSMAEAFDSSSTQASILYNTSTVAEAGTTLAVKNAAGDVLLSWEVPCSFSSALVSCPQMETGSTYTVVIGDDTEEITLEEISASYGDTQSSMFGGNMNRGGMNHRGGRFNNNMNNMNQDGMSAGTVSTGSTDTGSADTGSTDTAAAAFMEGMPGRPDSGQTPPDMTAMPDASQDGSTQAGQVSQDMAEMPGASQDGSTQAGQVSQDMAEMPGASQDGSTQTGQMPSDMSHGGMTGGPMQERQEQQEQSQEEEDDAAAANSNAEPVDLKTWCILGGCTLLLLAGIAVGKLYQRH